MKSTACEVGAEVSQPRPDQWTRADHFWLPDVAGVVFWRRSPSVEVAAIACVSVIVPANPPVEAERIELTPTFPDVSEVKPELAPKAPEALYWTCVLDPAAVAPPEALIVPVVTERDGARALLDGNCYVFSPKLAPMLSRGSLRYCCMVCAELGSVYQTQLLLETSGAPSPVSSSMPLRYCAIGSPAAAASKNSAAARGRSIGRPRPAVRCR